MELKIDNAAVERLVRENIRVHVAEALAGHTDLLVGKIVDEALKQPDPRSNWNREPQINKIVREMIQEAANEAVSEWLESEKPKIRKMVGERLKQQSTGLVRQIADGLTKNLAGNLEARVWVSRGDD